MKRTKFNNKGLKRTKGKAGRTGYFQPWMIEEAKELTGKLGARNIDMAEYFEVTVGTIDYWIKTKPEFARAVKIGRLEASLKVAQALYQKAIGFQYMDEQVIANTVKKYGENGKLISQHVEPLIVQVHKQLPPDAYAAHKYLSIIQREIWAETNSLNINHSHTGSVTVKNVEELSLDELSEDIKGLLFELNMKQLSSAQSN
jgi:hypothetical protein